MVEKKTRPGFCVLEPALRGIGPCGTLRRTRREQSRFGVGRDVKVLPESHTGNLFFLLFGLRNFFLYACYFPGKLGKLVNGGESAHNQFSPIG